MEQGTRRAMTTKQILCLDHGEQTVYVEVNHIIERAGIMYNSQTMIDTDHCTIRFRFLEKEISAEGQDTEQAIQRVEDRLPHGWHVRSCIACRYGHFCPYGDPDNAIFCIQDHKPRGKMDVCAVFDNEDDEGMDARQHSLFFCCDRFVRPGPGDYRYNDFKLRVD